MCAKHVVLTHFSQRYPVSQGQEADQGQGHGQGYGQELRGGGMPWDAAGSGATTCTLGYDLLSFLFPSQIVDLSVRTHALAAAIEKEHVYSKAKKGGAGG